MKKNSSTPTWAEDHFEDAFKQKKALVHRFTDFKDINMKLNSKKDKVAVPEQPADFLVTYDKNTFFAEVKSIEKQDQFSFSRIRPAQWKAAVNSIRNGGRYFFILYFKLPDEWYWLPASFILNREKQSVKIHEIKAYKVSRTFN